MATVTEITDAFVERQAALDPVSATAEGLAGHDHELTDYSPAGIAARADARRAALRDLAATQPADDRERIAAEVFSEDLSSALQISDAGEELRRISVIGSAVGEVREVFDLMGFATPEQRDILKERMSRVPTALLSLQETLREGMHRDVMAARRQALACAEQASTWGGMREAEPFFLALARRAANGDDAIEHDFNGVATAATDAYAGLAHFLTNDYAPRAKEKDAAGRERYLMWARSHTGMELDLDETYAWGWQELARIESEMDRVSNAIVPGGTSRDAIEFLEHDPAHIIEGVEPFRQWLQDLMDHTMQQLNGTHFDIPKPVETVEAMICPPGGAAAMYYTGPSEDFSRPGRTWYPTLGKTVFPLWHEVSTCYHEGVPGHHLQIAMVRYLTDVLTRYQRTIGGTAGHAEGWALYAERLMGELGYLDDPAWELGMLRAHVFRASRVVVDIGMHCELKIPDNAPLRAGETWTPEIGLEYMLRHGGDSEAFMRSEVDRYLGWPGQAICYKVGERVFLAAREDSKRRKGSAFDLKQWHSQVLALGPMGLDQLKAEIARL